ncbi:MAG: CPBP family intramembrane metalloprotease [Anaerolineae bacterium]|nr:CPBP family intramembrane metalloprotease [Anaerolineae bacterium]
MTVSTASQERVHTAHPAQSLLAWAIMLAVSLLPDVVMNELVRQPAPWLWQAKMGLVLALVVLTFAWKPVTSLRAYALIFATFLAAEWIWTWIGGTAQWQRWFSGSGFVPGMLDVQLNKLGAALVMILALFAVKRRRRAFFLVVGDLDAPAAGVRWLGIDPGTRWSRLGWIAGVLITLGTLAFLVLAGRPSLDTIDGVVPLLPAVLLFAAMNAFSEQVTYRASLLSTLHDVVGERQALLIVAFFFGMAHYYGVPYGVLGVVMSTVLGWFLSKAMLETRGFFWPWLIHFMQDVAIFVFIAAGSVTPGG